MKMGPEQILFRPFMARYKWHIFRGNIGLFLWDI